mgnify:CR=1 FL=1
MRDEEKRKSGLEKQRKKLAALEAQLVLAYPDLVLRVGQRSNRLYTFLLSSEFERTQWIEAVHNLQVKFYHCVNTHVRVTCSCLLILFLIFS